MTSWLARNDLSGSVAEDEVAGESVHKQMLTSTLTTASLILRLVSQPSTSALLLGYIAQCLVSGLTTARAIVTLLLYLIADGRPVPPSRLVSVASVITTNEAAMQSWDSVPSSLARPNQIHPESEVGTSSRANPPEPVSTLALLLPLLRQCSQQTPAPTPIVHLVSRLLSSLQPYPVPPLDVGLEAGGLFQSLPEAISVPLRDCLSGLMADLAVSQENMELSQPNPNAQTAASHDARATSVPTPSLPPFRSQLSLKHALAYQLSSLFRSSSWTTSDPAMQRPPEDHVALLKLGSFLAPDSGDFMQQLLRSSLGQADYVEAAEGVQRWLFITERLPLLLKWWKENPLDELPFPVSFLLPDAVSLSC